MFLRAIGLNQEQITHVAHFLQRMRVIHSWSLFFLELTEQIAKANHSQSRKNMSNFEPKSERAKEQKAKEGREKE